MNNTIYLQLFDAVVNTYLMQHCGLRPTDGHQYGMVGEFGQLASIIISTLVRLIHARLQ